MFFFYCKKLSVKIIFAIRKKLPLQSIETFCLIRFNKSERTQHELKEDIVTLREKQFCQNVRTVIYYRLVHFELCFESGCIYFPLVLVGHRFSLQ